MPSIRFFGAPLMYDDDGPITGRASQRHPLGILALLALAPHGTMSRDKVLALLWPEAGGKAARARLNTTVHALRSALGPGTLLSHVTDLRLDPGTVDVDVRAFEAAIASQAFERAAELYRGPFLDGFHLDSRPFTDWVEGERARLRRAHGKAVERLAERAEAAGDFPAAVEWWRQRANGDPYSGRVAVRLMEALDRAGNRAAALRHARVHSRLLEDELAAAPDPEVLRLAAAMRTGEPAVEGTTIPERRARAVAAGQASPESEAAPVAEPDQRSAAMQRSPFSGRAPLTAAVAAVLLVGTLGLVRGLVPDRDNANVALVPDRIAILPLANRTGDPALTPIGTLAADWVTQEVSRAGLGHVIPLVDLLQTFAPKADPAGLTAAEAARATGASIVLAGSYYRVGDRLQFQARVLDARQTVLIDAIEPILANPADPRQGIERLSQRVTGILATVFDPREIFTGGMTTQVTGRPPTLEAYQEYADGLDHFFRGDFAGAVPFFLRARRLDSSFHRATLRAVEAHINLAQWEAVDSMAAALEADLDRLAPHDRLLLEASRSHLRHDRRFSADRYDRLARLFPNSYYVYAAAWQGVAYNRPRAAVGYLESMDPTRGPMHRWHGYWIVFARALHLLEDYPAELEVARRAHLEFSEPDRLRHLPLGPLAAMGRFGELREALARAEAAGTWTPARLRRYAALELRAHGHPDTASTYLAEALEWHGTPARQESRADRVVIGDLLYQAGRYDSARTIYQGLLADLPGRDTGKGRAERIELRGRLGTLAARQGHASGARAADDWLRKVEWPYTFGAPDLWRARIAGVLGDQDRAVALLEEGLERANYGRWVHLDPDLLELRGHPGYEDLLRPRQSP